MAATTTVEKGYRQVIESYQSFLEKILILSSHLSITNDLRTETTAIFISISARRLPIHYLFPIPKRKKAFEH